MTSLRLQVLTSPLVGGGGYFLQKSAIPNGYNIVRSKHFRI